MRYVLYSESSDAYLCSNHWNADGSFGITLDEKKALYFHRKEAHLVKDILNKTEGVPHDFVVHKIDTDTCEFVDIDE